MKKIRKENQDQLALEKKNSVDRVKNIKDEYIKNEEILKNQLQTKLINLRSSHQQTLKQEKERLDRELKLIQNSHIEKMAELSESHDNQINQKSEALQNKLDSFEMKFDREKSKYNA